MKRDLVDELYKTAYKRYREKYPNKDFASIPNFLDSLWFSIEGELNRNGYDAARKYVEKARLNRIKVNGKIGGIIMTEKAQKLFEKFLKEYCNSGYIYSGMMLYEPRHIREYRELEELGLIQKRNCEGFAYELTERERYKLITDNNLEELWKKKAGCFMVNGKFEEIEKVMKR